MKRVSKRTKSRVKSVSRKNKSKVRKTKSKVRKIKSKGRKTKSKVKKTKSRGGAIRMPAEYFGKNSGKYSSNSNHKGKSFPWTDLNINL